MQPRAAIGPTTLGMDDAQLGRQLRIVVRARGRRTIAPGVVAAPSHPQRAAQDAHGKDGLLRVDEGKPYSLCLAKKAVAFFRMSRSMRSSRFSRRKRRSSLRSSSVIGTSGFGRVAAIHVRSVDRLTPRSRAIVVTGSEEVRTSRTASALNSGA